MKLIVLVVLALACTYIHAQSWKQCESQFSAYARPFRYGHTCALTTGARLACFSGIAEDGGSANTIATFNFLANQKVLTLPPNGITATSSRILAAAVLSKDRYYTIYGGYLGNSPVARPRLLVFDFNTTSFLNATETKVIPSGYNETNSNHFEFGGYGTAATTDTTTGDVWLYGGNTVVINLDFVTRVNPVTGTFYQTALTETNQPPAARYGSVFGFYQTGTTKTLWVWGGQAGQGYPDQVTPNYLNDHGKFDINTATWISAATSGTPPSSRAFMATTRLKNLNDLVVFGGRGASSPFVFNDVYRFNMATGAWSTISASGTPPVGRDRTFGVNMAWPGEDSVLYFAGADVNAGALDDFWYLILTTNNSSPIQPPPDVITSSSSSTIVLPSFAPNNTVSSSVETPTPTPPPVVSDSGADTLSSWISLLF